MVETIAFDMDGGAGSRNTSGERVAQAMRGTGGRAHQLGQCGDTGGRYGLPSQLPTLQRPPLSANTMRTVGSAPGTLQEAEILGLWSQQTMPVLTCIARPCHANGGGGAVSGFRTG